MRRFTALAYIRAGQCRVEIDDWVNGLFDEPATFEQGAAR